MGKKKTVSGSDIPGKTRLELRFDTEIYDGVKGLADRAEISINQLMQGLAKWAIRHLKPGEPIKSDEGFISGTRDQPGCLWAGETGTYRLLSKSELRELEEEFGGSVIGSDTEPDMSKKGKVWLFLDYTERRVLRDDV